MKNPCEVPIELDPVHSKMTITMLCDLESPLVMFKEKSYELYQTRSLVQIPVLRHGNTSCETVVQYEAISDAISNPYAGCRGELYFSEDENVKFIEIELSSKPRQPVQDTFRIILSDIEGPFLPKIGLSTCHVVIHNDRKVPVVEFEHESIKAAQTMGIVKIPIIRSESEDELAVVQWYIETIADGGIQPEGPFTGTEVFDIGQTRSEIHIGIPKEVMSVEMGQFEVILLDPIEQEVVTDIGMRSRCMVTVICNVARPEVTLHDQHLKVKRTNGEVVLTCERFGADDVTTSVPYYATSKNFLEIEDNVYQGIVSFKPGENHASIVFPLEQYPLGFQIDEIDFELGDPIGDKYPRLGANAYCLIEVQNDIPVTTLSFEEPIITCHQMEGECLIPVVRSGYLDCEVACPWIIDANTEGIIEFSKGQETTWIELPITQEITENNEDIMFQIKLKDMIECDFSSCLGEQTSCDLIVKMDRPRSRIVIPQSKYNVKQSEESVKIPVNRLDQLEGEVVVNYSITNDSENK